MIRRLKNYAHLFLAFIAGAINGFPARRLTIIGVTGTDGKTTTVNLIYHILKSAGYKAAMISTVGAAIGGKTYDVGFHVTTPSPFELQRYIKKAADDGSEFLILETTSHALDQYRVFGIHFKVSGLTNITHEHLDYHKTYDQYVKAKMKLFTNSEHAIIGREDDSYEKVKQYLEEHKITFTTYGLANGDITSKNYPFKINLLGDFNTLNTLAAIGVCRQLQVEDAEIRDALLHFKPPLGRQELVYDKEFRVMVDFAHTPNSFLEILPEVRKITKGRLIHVFGAAGKRDFTKRPKMGAASAQYADIIILTAEDPRNEKIEEINQDIMSGITDPAFIVAEEYSKITLSPHKKYIFQIPDRKKAIEFAIRIAHKNDFVITTGKSHEKSMNYGKKEESWDEFAAVESGLKKRKNLS